MIECPHLENASCEIASLLAEQTVPANENVCHACLACTRPHRINTYTMNLALKYKQDIDESKLLAIVDNESKGFGDRLANTLGLIAEETPDCGCAGHKDVLNYWSVGYIRKNLKHVINWLEYEAIKRSIPFSRKAAKVLLLALLATQPKD